MVDEITLCVMKFALRMKYCYRNMNENRLQKGFVCGKIQTTKTRKGICMSTWWIIFICDLLIPLMMVFFGKMMKTQAPKNINYIFGYRTTRSMKNEDTWKFAHEHCGSLWFKIGLIMLIPTVLVHIPFYNSNENIIGTVAMILMTIQVIALLVSIIPTELALKKNFNDDGTRK